MTGIIVQCLLIAVFAVAGMQKAAGGERQRSRFDELRLPPWLMTATGWIEMAGAAGLIAGFRFPWLAEAAGISLAILMLAAGFAHIRAKHPLPKSIPAFTLAIGSVMMTIYIG